MRVRNTAVRISAAHADTADLTPAGDDWAVVSGVPCQHVALPYPWATIGRVLALPGPSTADTLTQVVAWLCARSPQWTLMVRAEDEHMVKGFQRWDLMPVLALRSQPPSHPRSLADIGPAHQSDLRKPITRKVAGARGARDEFSDYLQLAGSRLRAQGRFVTVSLEP